MTRNFAQMCARALAIALAAQVGLASTTFAAPPAKNSSRVPGSASSGSARGGLAGAANRPQPAARGGLPAMLQKAAQSTPRPQPASIQPVQNRIKSAAASQSPKVNTQSGQRPQVSTTNSNTTKRSPLTLPRSNTSKSNGTATRPEIKTPKVEMVTKKIGPASIRLPQISKPPVQNSSQPGKDLSQRPTGIKLPGSTIKRPDNGLSDLAKTQRDLANGLKAVAAAQIVGSVLDTINTTTTSAAIGGGGYIPDYDPSLSGMGMIQGGNAFPVYPPSQPTYDPNLASGYDPSLMVPTTPMVATATALPTISAAQLQPAARAEYAYVIYNATTVPQTYSIKGPDSQWGTYTLEPERQHKFVVSYATMTIQYQSAAGLQQVDVPADAAYALADQGEGTLLAVVE